VIRLIFKATVNSKVHPEYCSATIPFPIPDSEYDRTIKSLEAMGLVSPTGQDCQVDMIESGYPILNRLATQSVNVDELDFLAKRLESFCVGEDDQFQAMASKLALSDIRDFINLTFCCQQATVITDFSDLEKIGKAHSLNLNGGSMSSEEYDRIDGESAALELIQSGAGTVTPYGVVYDNGMKMELLYDGRTFPEYVYDRCKAVVSLSSASAPGVHEYLYLPCADSKIKRAIQRVEAFGGGVYTAKLEMNDICEAVRGLFEDEFPLAEHLEALNDLMQCYQAFDSDDLDCFHITTPPIRMRNWAPAPRRCTSTSKTTPTSRVPAGRGSTPSPLA